MGEKEEKLLDWLLFADESKKVERYSDSPKKIRDFVGGHTSCLIRLIVSLHGIYRKEIEFLYLDFDLGKAVFIALDHDLGEILAGEISSLKIFNGEVTLGEKYDKEKEAWKEISKKFGRWGQKASNRWYEFESLDSPEAKFAVVCDKIEPTIHLLKECMKDKKLFPKIITSYGEEDIKKFPVLKNFCNLLESRLEKLDKKRKGLKNPKKIKL